MGQTLHGLVVVGGGLLYGHGTLGTAHLLSKPWECAKHKPNRKLGLLGVLKGESRIYKEAPPSTSTLEHMETKVQSTDSHFPGHRYVSYKRVAGRTNAGDLLKEWLMLVLPDSSISQMHDC